MKSKPTPSISGLLGLALEGFRRADDLLDEIAPPICGCRHERMAHLLPAQIAHIEPSCQVGIASPEFPEATGK